VVEDPPLELPQLVARLESEIVDEQLPALPVDGQRICLPPRSIEREHELGPGPLAQRMGRDDWFELRDRLPVPAELELAVDPLLDRRQPQLLEPFALVAGERLELDAG